MFILVVVFACLIPSLVDAASDEFSYNVTSGKVTVTCAFKFVYKLGGSRIDLRRSTAECFDLPRTIKLKDYDVSSECGSVFTISLTATKKATTLTAGTVTPSKGCKPTAPPPTTTMKPKPKRKCPYGTTYICPSFQDGSCLPKQVAVCFKEGKMGIEEPTGEMPVEMTTETSRAGKVEAYKPSKEEKEDVIAACMCMPNLALYAGALKVIAPAKKPGKGKGKPTAEMPATEAAERELEMEVEPRATCNEKFAKNFKIGKQVIKCNWVLVYTDKALDLTKSKATCKKDSSKALKAKNVAIKTTCGSVITMNLNVAKKTAITSGTITSVGESCKCYVAPTTAAQTAATTNAATTDAATTDAATTDAGTTEAGTTDAATTAPPKGTTTGGGKGGKGTTSGGGKGNGGGQGNGGGYSPLKSVFSPRFMNECACIEQGAIKKGKQ